MNFTKREVKSLKLKLVLELEFNNSCLTPEEVVDRISYLINSYKMSSFSDFIVSLLKETRSSTYELIKMEITVLPDNRQ